MIAIPRRVGIGFRFSVLAALLALSACQRPSPPALEVAGVTYVEADLLGLSPDRRLLLAELTAFGRAVSDSVLAEVGAPFVASREGDRAWALLRTRQLLDSAGVDDDVLRAQYRMEPELELTVRHLLVFSDRAETEPTRAAARERAQRALDRIRAGEDLAAVAAEVSEEPGAKARQGLLTPGREGAWVREFWTAALALEPGEVSPVTETQYGFHVLRLEARDTVPFDEARVRVAMRVAGRIGRVPVDAAEAPFEGDLAARRAAALDAARAVGIEVDEDWFRGTLADWVDAAEAQATILGFRPRMSTDELRDAARAALSATGQNAGLARDFVRRELAPWLALRWPDLAALRETLADGAAYQGP